MAEEPNYEELYYGLMGRVQDAMDALGRAMWEGEARYMGETEDIRRFTVHGGGAARGENRAEKEVGEQGCGGE